MNNAVTSQEVARACELLRANGVNPAEATRGDIRRVVGIGDRRARTIREWLQRGGEPVATSKLTTTFDQAYAAYKEFIGMSGVYRTPAPSVLPRSRIRIVAASDFHCPFENERAVNELLKEGRSTDLLVIPGDLADMWSFSRWPKHKKETEPVEEFQKTQLLLTKLAEAFPRVVVFSGNHDSRPRKYLAEKLPPEVMSYLELTGPGALHPLSLMIADLKNVEIAEPIKLDYANFSFIWQHGDCVFSHAERYSEIPNKAVSGPVLHWLKSFAEPQGIVKPFRAVIHGHSHQAGTVIGDFNTLCIENGCLASVQSYLADPKAVSKRPPQLGWSVIYQDNGITDFRESRFVPLQ